MKILSNKTNQSTYQNPTFKARSNAIKDVDNICRFVRREFPVMYSSSKLCGYSTLGKDSFAARLKGYSDELLTVYRRFYMSSSDPDYQMVRELSNMKKYNVGNCGEISDAVQVALKLNGYKDVKYLDLYAYNSETGTLRDMDHSVIGIDFKLPKDYEYNYGSRYKAKAQHRIYPQNNSIIIDAWLGKADYAKNMKQEYNYNKALINGVKKQWEEFKDGETLLKEGEEFCYIPSYQGGYISSNALTLLGKDYNSLILQKNKGKIDLTKSMKRPFLEILPEEKVKEIRTEYEIIPAQLSHKKLNNNEKNNEQDLSEKLRDAYILLKARLFK